MVVVLLAYWLTQYAACMMIGDVTLGVRTYLRTLFNGQGFWGVSPDASWFLYAYILLLVFMPFIRMLANRMRDVDFLCLFIMQVLIGCLLPSIMEMLSTTCTIVCQPFSLQPFSVVFGAFYMLLGYFAAVRIPAMQIKPGWRWIFAAVVVVFAALALSTSNDFWLSPFALCVFLSIKVLLNRVRIGWFTSKILILLGSAIFTVMLTENIFRTLFS